VVALDGRSSEERWPGRRRKDILPLLGFFFIRITGRRGYTKEAVMASARDIRVDNYCTRVNTELSEMKTKLLGFVQEIEATHGPEKEILMTHIPHFRDVIEEIDWKLGIMMKVCPFEWAGFRDVETGASVQLHAEKPTMDEISGGYLGG
jgi:hypothetical protein